MITTTQSLLQTQKLSLNQSLIQALKVLTLNNEELIEFLEEKCEENPLLKLNYKTDVKSLDKGRISSYSKEKSDNHYSLINNIEDKKENLTEHLLSSLGEVKLDEEIKEKCIDLITSLDKDGYYPFEVEDKIRDIVMRLDPVGCGAKDIWQSLLIQLTVKKENKEISTDEFEKTKNYLSKDGFEVLSDEKLSKHISNKNIILSTIKKLNPHPSSSFGTSTEFIHPEVSIKKINNTLQVKLEDNTLPDVVIDDDYIKNYLSLNKQDKKFISEKKQDALNLIRELEERKKTLLKLAEVIAYKQSDFFMNKKSMSPLTLSDVKDVINKDESTISRIINQKYVDTDYGVFPLKFFFRRKINAESENSISRDEAKDKLKEILLNYKNNNIKKPSDEKIKAELEKQGINISRRTVAKYRQELENNNIR